MISDERMAEILDVYKRLLRAHWMSCSDPNDPSRVTTYSEAAKAISDLLATNPYRSQG